MDREDDPGLARVALMARVVIFGTGRGADTAYRYLSRDTGHDICAFTVDARFVSDRTFHGRPVVPYEELLHRFPPGDAHLFVPLGFQQMNRLRAARYLDGKAKGYTFISYVSSRVSSLEPPQVGENCLVLPGQVFDLDVTIGNNVTLWSGNHIGDRSVIEDHAWLSSDVTLAGDVRIGEGAFLGVNCSVSNGVTIGARTFVGAQALVDRDTPPDSVWLAPAGRSVPVPSEKFLAMLRLT